MTITEAQKQWHISESRIIELLERGFIPGVTIIDGRIAIDDQTVEPIIPSSNATITRDSVVRYILRALDEFKYIDHRILCIPADQFQAIMRELEHEGYINKITDNSDYLSVKGFSLTEKGSEKKNAKKFALENIGFKLGFKYKAVYLEIGGNIGRQ